MTFVICDSCRRHVRASARACPFCSASLASAKTAGNPALRGARTRKRLLFGAAAGIVAGTAAACDEQSAGSAFYGTSCTAEECSSAYDGGTSGAFYGAAFTDSGRADDAASDASDAGDAGDADAILDAGDDAGDAQNDG